MVLLRIERRSPKHACRSWVWRYNRPVCCWLTQLTRSLSMGMLSNCTQYRCQHRPIYALISFKVTTRPYGFQFRLCFASMLYNVLANVQTMQKGLHPDAICIQKSLSNVTLISLRIERRSFVHAGAIQPSHLPNQIMNSWTKVSACENTVGGSQAMNVLAITPNQNSRQHGSDSQVLNKTHHETIYLCSDVFLLVIYTYRIYECGHGWNWTVVGPHIC